MKAAVRLTHMVELSVEAETEDDIMDWLKEHTPITACEDIVKNGGYPQEDYGEEILYFLTDNSKVDIKIGGD